ncbi:hypothetical protein AAFC00_001724 [Neodothiora populina]|uniref:Translocation protein sec66 n=1 Tax=Neodothiora populina TaxID=2781224 RepID=A0ABR3PPX6_9PEZI
MTMDWVGLLIPLAYLSILIGSLATFSSLYRKRKAANSASLEPWFPPHLQRNVYLSLLHLDPSDPSSTPDDADKSLSKIPDSIIKAALLRRAVEDIHRIIQVRNAKPALQTLLQRGSVGDELWQRFQRAEKEIEDEVKDVVEEANALAPGWGQIIFQSANEIANNQLAKQRMSEIASQLPAEKTWWDARKENISSGFMKELEDEEQQQQQHGRNGSVVSTASVAASSAMPATPTKGGSDDDAVLVEAAPQPPGSASKKRNKKNKASS